MSKLNNKGTNTNNGLGLSGNGNLQSIKPAAQQLFEIVVSTMYGKDSHYESNAARTVRLQNAVSECVKNDLNDFVANVIYKGRTDFHMRTMPVVLTVLFAEALRAQNKNYPELRKVVCDVIQRADQITDMYAYALEIFGSKKAIPMAIKKGVGDAFNKFSEYQFAKYNTSASVKMSDVIRIVHPVAKSVEQGEIFDKIMNEARPDNEKTAAGNLTVPYTWETELSQVGQEVAEAALAKGVSKDSTEYERMLYQAKTKKWEQLLKSEKVGYMALLRNLRNIHDVGIDDKTLDTYVYKVLSNKDQVAKSKQLPFRFLNAQGATSQFSNAKLQRALNKALDHSLDNVPQIGENVWIIMDVSASMEGGWGSRGNTLAPIDQAAIFSAALFKANADAMNVKLTIFSNEAAHLNLNPDDSVSTLCKNIKGAIYGGGTNLQAALNKKKSLGFEPDTVILLSDMEVDSFYGYGYGYGRRTASKEQDLSKLFDKDCLKLAFNFSASNTTPVGEKHGWFQLAGFSEAIFEMAPAMRNAESIITQLSGPYVGS